MIEKQEGAQSAIPSAIERLSYRIRYRITGWQILLALANVVRQISRVPHEAGNDLSFYPLLIFALLLIKAMSTIFYRSYALRET